jgi:hypothetical protein
MKNPFRFLAKLFAAPKPYRRPDRRVRLELQVLEDRTVPSQLLWTYSGSGAGAWSTAANWTDTVTGAHAVPGANDYALFNPGATTPDPGVTGTDTSCGIAASTTVNRVTMNSGYTATLSISTGVTLTVSDTLVQYGTLDLVRSAKVTAGNYFDIYGTVAAIAAGSAATAQMSTTGTFYLYSTGVINTSSATEGLQISIGSFDDSGVINVGTGTTLSTLTITGGFTENTGAVINDYGGSDVSFLANGASNPVFKGTINMYGAELDTDKTMNISGGTLNVHAGITNVIAGTNGSVGLTNDGVINVGFSGAGTISLTFSTGSLTVGALDQDLPGTGGIVNLYGGDTLSFSATNSGTFVATTEGVINMYGGTTSLGGVSTLSLIRPDPILPGGKINSYGATGFTDTITGNLSNSGTVAFPTGTSLLHTLHVSGNYTQGSSGTLSMRLDNSSASDLVTVGGTATLGGTLTLTGLHTLTGAGQTWTLISAGNNITTDFATINWPDSGNWQRVGQGTANYEVRKN